LPSKKGRSNVTYPVRERVKRVRLTITQVKILLEVLLILTKLAAI
jgi:hypothetical protein